MATPWPSTVSINKLCWPTSGYTISGVIQLPASHSIRERTKTPVWSPDGSHIAFRSGTLAGAASIYQKATNGMATEEALEKTERNSKVAMDWSRDGRYIVEGINDPKTKCGHLGVATFR